MCEKLIKDEGLDKPENSRGLAHGPFARSILIDAAKICFKGELSGIKTHNLAQNKLLYAEKALMISPNDAKLWALFHMFIDDTTEQGKALKAKVIFKAYELDQEDAHVQEILLRHYMSSPRTYKKAFMLIMKSTHQA